MPFTFDELLCALLQEEAKIVEKTLLSIQPFVNIAHTTPSIIIQKIILIGSS